MRWRRHLRGRQSRRKVVHVSHLSSLDPLVKCWWEVQTAQVFNVFFTGGKTCMSSAWAVHTCGMGGAWVLLMNIEKWKSRANTTDPLYCSSLSLPSLHCSHLMTLPHPYLIDLMAFFLPLSIILSSLSFSPTLISPVRHARICMATKESL